MCPPPLIWDIHNVKNPYIILYVDIIWFMFYKLILSRFKLLNSLKLPSLTNQNMCQRFKHIECVNIVCRLQLYYSLYKRGSHK